MVDLQDSKNQHNVEPIIYRGISLEGNDDASFLICIPINKEDSQENNTDKIEKRIRIVK